jgi:hypothetical protein
MKGAFVGALANTVVIVSDEFSGDRHMARSSMWPHWAFPRPIIDIAGCHPDNPRLFSAVVM